MADVSMPRLSDTMQEGTISRWLKQPGDEVKRGDIIAEIETDKATMEVEAFDAGILEQILVKEGETVPIGETIATIGSGANIQSAATTKKGAQVAQTAPQVKEVALSQAAPVAQAATISSNGQTSSQNAAFVKASPLARRIAEEHGVDLAQIKGTGPGGRIVRDDIEEFIEQRGATPVVTAPSIEAPVQTAPAVQTAQPTFVTSEDTEVVNLSTMQKTIARRLLESKQTVPHFYIGSEIDMTEALALRVKLNEALAEDGVKISVNDLIVKACALALEKYPEVNGSYRDGQFILHKKVHVGIAVDIPAGLVVPVIRDTNVKGLRAIAKESKALITKAQAGKITPADLEGGTFSISNLGMMDVSDFVAVINPPQAAILAVAATRKMFVPINDQPVVRDIMHVTLSADHRILYGATVARFLKEVKRLLQNPYLLLA